MTDPQLMKLFEFDESDLQANRSGRISERQTTRLRKMEATAKKQSFLGCAGNFFMALIGAGGAVWIVMTMNNEAGLDFGTICFVGIFGILWPLLWGAAGVLGLRRVFANVETALKKAEGAIAIEKTIRSSYNSDSHTTTHQNIYELRVSGYTFIVNPVLQNYIKRGDVYSVYFADFNHEERSKEILSVELLADAGRAFTAEPVSMDDIEVVEYLKKGDVLRAIRAHRSIHGSDFEEAKSIVEDIKARLG